MCVKATWALDPLPGNGALLSVMAVPRSVYCKVILSFSTGLLISLELLASPKHLQVPQAVQVAGG